MRFPFPKLTAVGAGLCLAVALGVPVPSAGQSLGELARKIRASKKTPKSASKVWTNESIRSLEGQGMSIVGAPPPPPAPETSEQRAPTAQVDPVWAELDAARAEREGAERYIATLRQQIEDWTAQLGQTDDPTAQEMLGLGIEANQQQILVQQELITELDARIAALEQQTAGKTRPAPQPPQAPAQGEAEAPSEAPPPPPPSS